MPLSTETAECRKQIRHQAIRYLSYREHAVDELRHKLCIKFNETDEIDLILTQLLAEDLLSEQRYADAYLRARVNKGFGPDRIRAELIHKGIHKSLIEQTLKTSEINWAQQIRKVWVKKFDGNKPDNLQMQLTQSKFLQHRGFPFEQIKQLLSN